MKNKFFDFTKEVFTGKSIGRILFNWQIQKHCQGLKGVCVDLAAGTNPSYYRYWNLNKEQVIKVDYKKNQDIDIVADLNQKLPFEDNYADNVFLFNAIYIIDQPKDLLKEIHRVLKPNGVFFLNSPLINNEAPEPHDYFRFTSEGIKKLLSQAGFNQIELYKIGERVTAAASLLHNFWLFNFIRFFVFGLALFLDWLIPLKTKNKYPCPMAYFVISRK